MLHRHPQECEVRGEEFLDCGKVAQGRTLLVELDGAHLLVQEARAERLVVVEQLPLELEEDVVDALGGIPPVLSVNLRVELPGQ